MALILGVDTGGTFTDFVLFDTDSGSLRVHKRLSTPQAPEQAILQGIVDLNVSGALAAVVHGSTVATNAVLEGKGVDTAYIANRGLGDVLAIGRQARESLYSLQIEKRPPLVAADKCFEVDSRLSAQGEALAVLDQAALETLVAQIRNSGVQAVAINLLFSFIDDTEEMKIEQALRAALPELFISRSSDVLPEYREYERGVTTTLNAMVGPLMQGYLQRLEAGLQQGGSDAAVPLAIMQSSGGTTSADEAGRYPVKLLLSGPAGGLRGALCVAEADGEEESRLLSFDMGGTSTDVSILDGGIAFSSEAHIGHYPVAVPMVDMHTIGAGGGSIARLDAGGMLLVGPQSAGADPGPACYGRGGTQATVTDANVVLGRLQSEAFLGGGMRLDRAAAEQAVAAIAGAAGMSLEQAASGIIDIVNDHMVRALRVMSVERGEDPKDFCLVSFGGAGGLHVCALAEQLEMRRAMVPVHAGVLSALGMLAAEASRERSRSINRCLDAGGAATLATELQSMLDDLVALACADLLATASVVVGELQQVLTVDLRYAGQSHCLNLPWQRDMAALITAFHYRHRQQYGHQLAIPVELVNLRVRVIAPQRALQLPEWQPQQAPTRKQVKLPLHDKAIAVYKREGLQCGQLVEGPALITEACASTWLAPGWQARVDRVGNLRLTAG